MTQFKDIDIKMSGFIDWCGWLLIVRRGVIKPYWELTDTGRLYLWMTYFKIIDLRLVSGFVDQ
jgi:hypothetical protein